VQLCSIVGFYQCCCTARRNYRCCCTLCHNPTLAGGAVGADGSNVYYDNDYDDCDFIKVLNMVMFSTINKALSPE
jgi:hypothetical protein